MEWRIRLVARTVDELDVAASLLLSDDLEEVRKAQCQFPHRRGAKIDVEAVGSRLRPMETGTQHVGGMFGPVDLEVTDVGVEFATVEGVGEHSGDRL